MICEMRKSENMLSDYQVSSKRKHMEQALDLKVGETVSIEESGILFKAARKSEHMIYISSPCITLLLNFKTKLSILEQFALLVKDKTECPLYHGPKFVDRMFGIIHHINILFGMEACKFDDVSFFKTPKTTQRSITRVLDLIRGYSMYDKQGFMRVDNAGVKSDPKMCVQEANKFLNLINHRACSPKFYQMLQVWFSNDSELEDDPDWQVIKRAQVKRDEMKDIPLSNYSTLRELLQYAYDHDPLVFDRMSNFIERPQSINCITFYQDDQRAIVFHPIPCNPKFEFIGHA
jgi:hypothetical protein